MRRLAGPALLATLTLGTGCQSVPLRLLNVLGVRERPLSVALVADEPREAARALNPFPDYSGLQQALAHELRRPVAVDVCFRFQAQAGLHNGWYDVAVLAPTQYANLSRSEEFPVLALPLDLNGRIAQRALLIVPLASDLQAPEDLRGKVVAFGPADDPLTHRAAVEYLRAAGVKPVELMLERLPVPGTLRHLPTGSAVAREVLSGDAAAGFVTQAEWDQLPAASSAPAEPARNRLRVIGQTEALPAHVVLGGAKLDPELLRRLQQFLYDVETRHPEVLLPLRIAGYRPPTPATLAACRSLRDRPEPAAP